MRLFFNDFLKYGLRATEIFDTKFPYMTAERFFCEEHDQSFCVGVVDGQTKLTIMFAIVAIVNMLEAYLHKVNFRFHSMRAARGHAKFQELTPEELADPTLASTLGSFKNLRCSFQYHENPTQYHFEALRAQDKVSTNSSV